MSDAIPRNERNSAAFGALIAGLVFLFIGFVYLAPPAGVPSLEHYTIAAVYWGTRGLGLALLAVAGLYALGLGAAAWLGLVVEGLAAILCIGAGPTLFAYGYPTDGVVLLILGLLSAREALSAWRMTQRPRFAAAGTADEGGTAP